jgi:hypothetical protein
MEKVCVGFAARNHPVPSPKFHHCSLKFGLAFPANVTVGCVWSACVVAKLAVNDGLSTWMLYGLAVRDPFGPYTVRLAVKSSQSADE